MDSLTGAMLKKALFALRRPQTPRLHKDRSVNAAPPRSGSAQAFVELIQRYPTKKLPKTGGLNATVVALIPLQTLIGGLKAAHLDTGEPISPGAARRLACEAGIIPAVLGGNSQVLDLGRKNRFHNRSPTDREDHRTPAAAKPTAVTCPRATATCTTPPAGPTAASTNRDGVMICPWHHHRAHDTRYEMTRQPDRADHRFHRRT